MKFGNFFNNEVKVKIFEDYQKNSEFIHNWEKSHEGKLKKNEHLKRILSVSWDEYCQKIIRELKNSVSLETLFQSVFLAKKEETFNLVSLYSKKLLENYEALVSLNKINEENLECLKLKNENKSYLENFQNFFFESYNSFLQKKIIENPDCADDEVLKILAVIIEITQKVRETNFEETRIEELEQKSLKIFWKEDSNVIHKVKELNKFCEVFNVTEITSKLILIKGLKTLLNNPSENNLVKSLIEYVEQESEKVENFEIIQDLRACCRKIIPFYLTEDEEYLTGNDLESKIKFKKASCNP